MTQQEFPESLSASLDVLQSGMRGSFRGSPSRAAVQRVIDRLHGLALGDRDIAREGDGGGGDDDEDGDDQARGIASAAGSPSAAATTSPTSARLAHVPPGAAVAALTAAFEAGRDTRT